MMAVFSCLTDTMISRSSRNQVREKRESSPPGPPITIQVQVPGVDTNTGNNSLTPQQACPAFSGDSVLAGAFKKISNAVRISVIYQSFKLT